MTENKVVKNATWIIACKIIQSVLGLIISMISSRYFGPSGYGLINYAISVVAFVVPIMQLGLNSILVQEIVGGKEREGAILGTSLTMSFITSFFTIGGVILFVSVANAGERDTLIVCALYSIVLITQSLELIQYWFQAKLKSKYTSIVMLIAYVAIAVYRIVLLVSKKSIYWYAVSYAMEYCIISIALLIIYKKCEGDAFHFSWRIARALFKKSKYYILSGLMITVFAQTGRIMLKIMIDDAATGYYSAAVTCVGLTNFVFTAIIDSARPSVFEGQKISYERFETNITRLYSIVIYLSLLQSVFLTILAKPIIYVLFGKQYMPAVPALQIMSWYSTFSYLGSVHAIWILAEGKQKTLWVINLSGALFNIVLNALLIPIWGVNGAAVTALATQFFTNVIVVQVIKGIRGANKLALKSCNPKYLIEMGKILFNKKTKSDDNQNQS